MVATSIIVATLLALLFSKIDVATIVPCRDLVAPSFLLHSASQPQFLVATLFLLSPLQF